MPGLRIHLRAAIAVMALLVAATGPPRTAAQLFPFTSLRHIFDNLKIRGGGNSVARIHSEHEPQPPARPVARPVAPPTQIPHHHPLSNTASAPSIFLVDPESQYRKIELNRSRHVTPIPIPASSNTAEQKSPPVLNKPPPRPPIPSSYLQPPPKDLPLRVDLSEVSKLAAKKVKIKLPDNSAASSVDIPKNHKLSPTKKVANHRLETDVPPNHKKKAPSINTPRKRPEKHVPSPTVQASMDVNRLKGPVAIKVAPVVEQEQSSATHLEVPEGGEDRVEFQMHGLQGPKSYKFGYDTGKGLHRQFRYEERDQHGNVRGHYGYMDDEGKLQVVNYKADPHTGYHADVSKLHL